MLFYTYVQIQHRIWGIQTWNLGVVMSPLAEHLWEDFESCSLFLRQHGTLVLPGVLVLILSTSVLIYSLLI